MSDCTHLHPSRRAILGTAGALFGWAAIPAFARDNSGRDPRLVVMVLRGALDGLAAVAPTGDPDYAGLHGALALSRSGDRPALPLDSFFALHPAMPVFHGLYLQKQAAIIHAVATGYRERSHFDGQDVLESGYPAPGFTLSGWLNRAVAALPVREKIATNRGLGVGSVPPLVIRGPAPVLGWAPQTLPAAEDDLAARLLALYRHTDPMLGDALARGLETDRVARNAMGAAAQPRDNIAGMRRTAEGAARLIAADDGPRLAALAYDGWDTHANEGGTSGRLAQLLSGLDGAFDAFRTTLGPLWRDTIVVAITEFGRTARINGTVGTDHGTGSVAFLAGGAVAGGRIIADWPGLSQQALHEGRDLAPTTDLRAVLKGLLADHLGLGAAVLGADVFPNSPVIAPMGGLVV